MSLVGTRPILPDELEQYELHHRARIAIKPGITGMWQVSGRSDITDFEEIVRLDTEYISEWNIGLDIKILFKPNFVESVGEFVPEEKRENQFVFAGRLDKLKGIDILFEVWKQMGTEAPKLVVCGTGLMENWCRRFISENDVNIEMRGFVPNEEARKLIAVSRALVLPTQWYEGFPI